MGGSAALGKFEVSKGVEYQYDILNDQVIEGFYSDSSVWGISEVNGDLIFSFGVNNYNQVLGAGIQFDINLTQAFKKMLELCGIKGIAFWFPAG